MAKVLPIERLRVRSLDADENEITWELADGTLEDALDYTFQILRSESPEGPFDAITQPFEERYIFVDRRLPAGDKFRQIWYRLQTKHKASGALKDYGPVCREAEPDLIANYTRRMEQTLLTQATGRLCWLFPRRSTGLRCLSCWDSISKRKTRANCLSCYDTGFLRGYNNPIEVWIQIDPAAKAVQNNSQQTSQTTMTTARMTFYPNVRPKDLIVESENKRWRVEKQTQSERLRTPIKQELVLFQLNDTDIEYRIPIKIEQALKDIQASPPRMFTNPTDLMDSIDEMSPDIFANYPTYPRDPEE